MCTYCGCHELTFIGRLAAEHDALIEQSGDLRRAGEAGDGPAARRAVEALGALLTPHTREEEAGLFAELSGVEGFAEHVESLCAEHTDLDADLAQIGAGDLGRVDPFLLRLRRHIDREENGLFPAAAIALDADALSRLGDRDAAGAG